MPRLRAIRPRVDALAPRLSAPSTPSDQRMAGRALQARRLRLWAADPHCVDCQELTSYPHGFELDHEVALVNGGKDTDENCRVRCLACHEAKTKRDMAEAGRAHRR